MSEETKQGNTEQATDQDPQSDKPGRDEWADIGRRIETQIRRDLGRATGADEDASWDELGHKWETKVRTEIASAVGAEQEADWPSIGRKVESQLKAGLGGWADASAEDDWSTVGSKISTKIQKMLDRTLKAEKKAEEAPESAEAPSTEEAKN